MNIPDSDAARSALLDLLRTKAFSRRAITLSSGKTSNFYVDCREVTLDAVGHVMVGRTVFDAVVAYEKEAGRSIAAVGGLTLGADPIASAASLVSALLDHPLPAFIVRKEAKGHGTGKFIEGLNNIPDGAEVVIVEDVVTTGGSSGRAVERVRAAGYRVDLVIALVDRLEGGRENLEATGVRLVTLFDRSDFMDDDPLS